LLIAKPDVENICSSFYTAVLKGSVKQGYWHKKFWKIISIKMLHKNNVKNAHSKLCFLQKKLDTSTLILN
jgi:hypothetical protein